MRPMMMVYLLPKADMSRVRPKVWASTDVIQRTAMKMATCVRENPTTWQRERERVQRK